MLNFTIQDVLGILLALCMYPFVFVFPGYVVGWLINLFNFRDRTSMAQIIMAMCISASAVPSALFLVYRFGSAQIAIGLAILIAIVAVFLFAKSYRKFDALNGYVKVAIVFSALWLVLSIISLVDFQIGDSLYFSTNSYDFTTRVSVVNAITRSGVPPVNPSYYPGHPVLLNSLYYYWYIPVSMIDQMAGTLVSAHQAMIASVGWAGLLLFATLATYLRVRDKMPAMDASRKSLIALQLLVIGGLDFIMIFIIAASLNFQLERLPFQGHVEGWNMPIMSWMNALAWVPHHLVAALACMPCILLVVQNRPQNFFKRIPSAIFIGLAFASAFGLSVWVMFVFAIFWSLWAAVLIFKEKKYQDAAFMMLGAVLGLIFVSPFLLGLHGGGVSSPSGGLPVEFYVRPFMIVDLLDHLPSYLSAALNILFLPVNYLFELGFFLIMAALWFQDIYHRNQDDHSIFKAEALLFAVSVLILSFVRSTIIIINDLGIRGWLPVQFLLVIWSSDVLFRPGSSQKWVFPRMLSQIKGSRLLRMVLSGVLVIGYLTMSLEFISLRGWPIFVDVKTAGINDQSRPDNSQGERTYSARMAYGYLEDHVDPRAIVQNNSLVTLDRPSGLYGNHQMVISDRTIYGVSLDTYYSLADDVGGMFSSPDLQWEFIDKKCDQYLIDYIIVSDRDPLWLGLQSSENDRPSLYQNDHYAIYACGN
jgi:hypothetical protein